MIDIKQKRLNVSLPSDFMIQLEEIWVPSGCHALETPTVSPTSALYNDPTTLFILSAKRPR